MEATATAPRTLRPNLFSGPPAAAGAESLAAHRTRLGGLPRAGEDLVVALEQSGLRGRGGAAFPVGTKWRSVAQRAQGRAAVLVNGAEGEPLSHKDRALMTLRPHLVLDGAVLAARSVGAQRVVLYLGGEHLQAQRAIEYALRERAGADGVHMQLSLAPARYVSGEETAAVRFVNEGTALPIGSGVRPFERGVDALPTLVQNVESLAQAAMIAQRGAAWYRSVGSVGAAGTLLVSVGGGVLHSGVLEVAVGTPVGDAIEAAGGSLDASGAVLLGGYFGGWLDAQRAWSLPLESQNLQQHGAALGCGVIAVLPAHQCGVAQTAAIMRWLAAESARQCGPCVFGLGAIAGMAGRVVHGGAPDDLLRLRRWSGELPGRGGCRHPDGAAQLMRSALQTFADDYQAHLHTGRCLVRSAAVRAA